MERKCGCKGIRTCLLCEQQSKYSVSCLKTEEEPFVYTYCPGCNLCWPDAPSPSNPPPLHVGRVRVIPEFLSREEESSAVASIDSIPWMPSQSGRRKQDFGPKVNFKKKKVRIGEFRGFPKFTESTLRKFKGVPELSDFRPVELCHLEYCPDRGSSIVPHVDDFWLWGERLVTVNLGSSTVLCLTPSSENDCECVTDWQQTWNQQNGERSSCRHNFEHALSVESSVGGVANENGNVCSREMSENLNKLPSSTRIIPEAYSEELQRPEHSLLHEDFRINSASSNRCPTSESNRCDIEMRGGRDSSRLPKIGSRNATCRVVRSGPRVRIRVELPPRSLLILAGCARYNWYHEIRRVDVPSRRLAMTFRELSAEFLDGGEESCVGRSLLETASRFYDC